MLRKIFLWICSGLLMLNLCGCWGAFLAGLAGGAGSAVWLSGKLTEKFNAPYEKTVDAAHAAMHDLGLQTTKESKNGNNAEIKGVYSDGRDMWVDIQRLTDNSAKVEVRVGGVTPDKQAAGTVMSKIQSHL